MSGRIRRTIAVVALAAAILALPATAGRDELRAVAPLERAILVEINAVRQAHGLPPLRPNAGLARAAAGHSREMATLGFFGHDSSDGTAFWKRIARSYPSRGYRQWSVGENLLWSTSELRAAATVRRWLESPSHRKVLLNRVWREAGISAIRASGAPGRFAGRDVTVVTADFGRRR